MIPGLEQSVRLLEQAGFNVLGADNDYLYIEDTGCISRSFETFSEYAMIAVWVITGALLMGWAISMIRGAKNDIKNNIKRLFLIFMVLSAIGPAVNLIYGGDLFGAGCETVRVALSDVNNMLEQRKLASGANSSLYESIEIFDSGAPEGVEPDLTRASQLLQELEDLQYWTPEGATGGQTGQSGRSSYNMASFSGPMASSVVSAKPGEVIYSYPDGSQYRHVGGTLCWRLNNPGAMTYTSFTKSYGAIASYDGKFAIFPSPEVGRNALVALLKTSRYQNLTLAKAMERYAPWADNNNPEIYAQTLAKGVGVSVNTLLRDMNELQLQRMAEGISRVEGYTKQGTRERIK